MFDARGARQKVASFLADCILSLDSDALDVKFGLDRLEVQ